jgi:peroxidase
MNARRITRSIALLVCSLPAIPLLAASPNPEITRLWFQHPYNPTSRDVFEAFESMAAPNASLPPVSPLSVDAAPAVYPNEFRTIDGRNNATKDLGQAGTVHLRNTTVGYADGTGSPAGPDRKSAREISNLVDAVDDPGVKDASGISSFVWSWGNIVDHDMTLLKVASPPEELDVDVPACDIPFDPGCRGDRKLHFQRSNSTVINGIRQQINANSAFIDASVVYGSDLGRSRVLRTFDGTGHLLTSENNLLPFNLSGIVNQPERAPDPTIFFLAGDVRANENTPLTALQTVLMREHNTWANTIKAGDPTLDDDGIFQRARAIVCAEIQLITYRDFIPIVLGPNALTPYAGYNEATDPRVSIAFSTVAFRMAHSMVPPEINLLNKQGVLTRSFPLGETVFAPKLIATSGIEPFLRGLAKQVPQDMDAYVINAIRSFQVGGIRPQGFDLVALDIQRGRDQGMPSYNQTRIDFGLAPKADFTQVTSDTTLQGKLLAAYPNGPDDADPMICGMAEDHVNGGLVGETFWTILKDQFERTRDGDRFWYESYLDAATLATVQAQTLGTIIKRNAVIGAEMQDDVFHIPAAR